jgi:very-short-patch-repair endonuclease
VKIIYTPKLTQYARQLRNHPTQSERILWRYLKGDQLGYDFHRQKPIGFYIADFFCFQLKLVIELDGITHHDLHVQKKDARKTAHIEKMGVTVMRFKDEEVFDDVGQVIEKIKAFIKEVEAKDTPPASPS